MWNKKAEQMTLGECLRRVEQVLVEGWLGILRREAVVHHAGCRVGILRKRGTHLLQHLDALVELSQVGVHRDADRCTRGGLGEELAERGGVHCCARACAVWVLERQTVPSSREHAGNTLIPLVQFSWCAHMSGGAAAVVARTADAHTDRAVPFASLMVRACWLPGVCLHVRGCVRTAGQEHACGACCGRV